MLKKWDELPDFMKTDDVRPYYEILKKKKTSLALKRAFDFVGGLILLVVLAIPMAIIAVWIKLDSEVQFFIVRNVSQHMGSILKSTSSEQWLIMLTRLVQL